MRGKEQIWRAASGGSTLRAMGGMTCKAPGCPNPPYAPSDFCSAHRAGFRAEKAEQEQIWTAPPPPANPRRVIDGGAKKFFGVLAALAVIITLVAIGSRDHSSSKADNPYTYAGPPAHVGGGGGGPVSHEIVYYLTGSARTADLTLSLGPGGQSQQRGVDVPLYNKNGTEGLRFTAADGDFLYLSAQNKGGGVLHCRITEDGVTVAENTSRGQYAIVTCDGSA